MFDIIYCKVREMQEVNDDRIFFIFLSIVLSTRKYDETHFCFILNFFKGAT